MVDVRSVPGPGDAHLVDTGGFRARGYCGVYVLRGDPAVVVETGASPTVDRVLEALDALDVDREAVDLVAPTHIHLDHAGATGHLLEALPNATAVLHEDYADYLVEPEGLLASVKEAVGPRFDQYGTCRPFGEDRVRRVAGGEVLEAGDQALEVHHAPGHAPHHVIYLDRTDGTLYTGDAAGMRLPANDVLEVTTPPPAFDLDDYLDTLDLQRDLDPDRLALTHFGVVDDVDAHLAGYEDLLQEWVDEVLTVWDAHDDEEAAVDNLLERRDEWSEAYHPEDNRAIRRMDAKGVLKWAQRTG